MVDFNHSPVLLKETLDALNCREDGFYLDCTTGRAGHSSEILRKLGREGFLFCIDRDIEAITNSKDILDPIGSNYKLIKSNYSDIDKVVELNSIPLLDGIFFDLGVSSPQLDDSERGFSFSKTATLDMRLGQDEEETFTAKDLVNKLSKDELVDIFSKYGEEPYSKTIAEFIVNERKKTIIETTTQLSDIVVRALVGKKYKGNIHPATRVFQALRIKVNDELEGIRKALPLAVNFTKSGGRVVVISFHSLEDRIVKETFKMLEKGCTCPPKHPICVCGKKSVGKMITRKPIIATDEEIKLNPRARSAKLRIFEKK